MILSLNPSSIAPVGNYAAFTNVFRVHQPFKCVSIHLWFHPFKPLFTCVQPPYSRKPSLTLPYWYRFAKGVGTWGHSFAFLVVCHLHEFWHPDLVTNHGPVQKHFKWSTNGFGSVLPVVSDGLLIFLMWVSKTYCIQKIGYDANGSRV